MKISLTMVLGTTTVLAACADSGAGYTPILDGTPNAAYQSDLKACQNLAKNQKQFDQEAVAAAVIGGGVGAVLGDLDEDANATEGMIAGALGGGVAGAVNANERRQAIVIECLKLRGHPVVG